jgi:ubiquinone/menaquinone biosynthesis C-methylase UbiE
MSLMEKVRTFGESLGAGSRVLDVGCGLRPYERFFAHCEYVGVDVEVSGRDSGTKKPDHFYDGMVLPFGDGEFDALICTQVLEHCADHEMLVSEFHRVLRKEGRILVTVPFIWGEHEVPFDFRRFTSFGIGKLMERHRFRISSFEKITCGVDAVFQLVESEITHSVSRSGPLTPGQKIMAGIARALWKVLLRIWRGLYRFDRIYLDNAVIAERLD